MRKTRRQEKENRGARAQLCRNRMKKETEAARELDTQRKKFQPSQHSPWSPEASLHPELCHCGLCAQWDPRVGCSSKREQSEDPPAPVPDPKDPQLDNRD